MLLTYSRLRPGIQLSNLQGIEQPPTTEFLAPNVNSVEAEKILL